MEVALIIAAYLLGSVPSGYLVARLAGVDIRNEGSGNLGATNVARVIGKRQGILTLIADTAKGWLPVFVALQLGIAPSVAALGGVAAFLGHLYPVFLRFRGGKGVATAFGVLLAVAPLATLVLILIFAVVVLSSRFVSLGSVAAAAAAPIIAFGLSYSPVVVAMSGFLALLIILRHRTNIQRLRGGTEPKFTFS
ncbi:MAG TPA: glycerol-3-phosphate 1-O-acyltransferase PlsY [Candidatus Binatia bacterium]|nr:glycerol-3-phosphate 1-O-acyltransferase PlsY [Candidatus Binatia bacterium]